MDRQRRVLVASPRMVSDTARHWIIATLSVVLGFAALATCIVHPTWSDERGVARQQRAKQL